MSKSTMQEVGDTVETIPMYQKTGKEYSTTEVVEGSISGGKSATWQGFQTKRITKTGLSEGKYYIRFTFEVNHAGNNWLDNSWA